MTRLVVAPEAESDVETILTYLETVGGSTLATRYGDAIRNSLMHLIEFPRSGAPRPQLGRALRIWLVPPYVLFYRYQLEHDTVRLPRGLHERRDATSELIGGQRRR